MSDNWNKTPPIVDVLKKLHELQARILRLELAKKTARTQAMITAITGTPSEKKPNG